MTISFPYRKKSWPAMSLALLLVLPSPAPAASPPDHGTALAAVGRALERWDLPAARDALAGLEEAVDPALGWARGMIAFYEGNYGEALEQFEKAPTDPSGQAPTGMAALARANLEMSGGLRSFESEHFIVRLDPGKDWVLAAPALETLEEAYQSLGRWLGHFPREKIRVEIVPAAGLFERVSSLTERDIEVSGAIGICKFNKIMLLSPRQLLRGYRWRDSLVHEYIHYLLVAISANGAPIWLQEGVARYGETFWRSEEPLFFTRADEGLVAEALAEGSLIGFDEMDPSLVRLPSMSHVRLAFAECALAVEYLLSQWNDDGLRKVLAELSGKGGTSRAMKTALGVSLGEFEEGWRASLEGRTFRALEGLRVRQLKIASGDGGHGDWEVEHWQGLKGQRHLKLGDMLRKREHHGAALREYGKALEAAPASPLILNRMARSLMDLERFDEAGRHLRQAVDIHPDYAASYANLAAVLAVQGDWNGAETALREYLDINPYDPFTWQDLGKFLAQGGRLEEGKKAQATADRLVETTGR